MVAVISSHLDELFAPYPVHLTVSQVAEVLGIRPSTAYKWLSEGRIPAYRVGGSWVILRDEVKEAMAQSRNRPHESDEES